MIKVNGYNLKNFKTMEGHECYIMRGTLMKNGKPVTDFFNDGNGGETMFGESLKKLEPIQDELFNIYKKNGLIELKNDGIKDEKFFKSFILDDLITDIAEFQEAVKDARKLAKKNGTKDAIVVASVCNHQGFNSLVYTIYATKVAFNRKEFEKKEFVGSKLYKFKRILAVVENVCNTNVDAKLFEE